MNITLYGNDASGNHGCEAIVRGAVALLGTEKILSAFSAAAAVLKNFCLSMLWGK